MALNFPNSPTDGQIYEGYQWDATKGVWVSGRYVNYRPASSDVAGIVELATPAETQSGTDTTRAVTPAGLISRTATDSRTGVVELATSAETQAGTDATRAVTPSGLTSAGLGPGGRLGINTKGATGNWNSYVENGWYSGPNLTNQPSGVTYGWVIMQVVTMDANWTLQIATDLHNHRKVWTRQRYEGTWTAWVPTQAGFTAQLSSNYSVSGTTAWTRVPFNLEWSDYNGVFDTTNSRFVAPGDGHYTFFASMIASTTTGGPLFKFRVNNEALYAQNFDGGAYNDQYSSSAFQRSYYLTAGSYVEVWMYNANSTSITLPAAYGNRFSAVMA